MPSRWSHGVRFRLDVSEDLGILAFHSSPDVGNSGTNGSARQSVLLTMSPDQSGSLREHLSRSGASPHHLWASYRPLATGYFRLAASLAKHLLQLFNFAAGNELLKRFVISAFRQIGLQHLLEQARQVSEWDAMKNFSG
jgi:hypothetical protein